MDLDKIHEFAEQFAQKNGFDRWWSLVLQSKPAQMDSYACNLLYDWKEALIATNKPIYCSNGYQTAKDYAKAKGWQTDKYVYQLVRDKKLDFIRVKELNNLLLVKEKTT